MPVSADPPGLAARKAEIRTRLLAARRDLPGWRVAGDAAKVHAALRTALAQVGGAGAAAGPSVAAYVPVGVEPGGPDLPAVLSEALGLLPPVAADPRASRRLLLPVLRDDLDLDWTAYRGTLVPAGRGLTEPAGPRLGVAAIAGASLVIAPAVAVDHQGVRLGRGGGSYDRALARVPPGTDIVALLYDDELLSENLPAEPHDRRVSAVITPTRGLIRLPVRSAGRRPHLRWTPADG